jgi:hypothetical protein
VRSLRGTAFNSAGALKETLAHFGSEIDKLKSRLDNITGAFEPATVYAPMETAVYDSIDERIDVSVNYNTLASAGTKRDSIV